MGADIAANFSAIRERIAAACTRAGRDTAGITLVAVTKGQPPQAIQAAIEAGHFIFGENRVQEAKAKIPQCAGRASWHMIGHLQSNKARDAVHFFEMIESVDTLSLATEVNKWAEKSAKTMPILLEVNAAGESSKFGYNPSALLEQFMQINALPKIEVRGLMTVAPWSQEPEKVRPVFRKLRDLKEQCEQKLGASLPHLSMGMSGDFEVAIEEGATIVRIGTALFGPRPKLARESDGP
jgi:hypothetical protein